MIFRHAIFAFLSSLVLTSIIGCEARPITACDVYIDNCFDNTVVVSVDGKQACEIEASEVKQIRLFFGDRNFQITSGDEVVYNANHLLELGDDPKREPTYMLDPSGSSHYCRVSVVYGDDSFAQGVGGGISSIMTRYASREIDTEDEEERKQWIEKQDRNNKFHNIVDSLSAFGGTPLSQFVDATYVLKSPPRIVGGNSNSMSESRSTVVRIPKELHTIIDQFKAIEEPTDDDISQAAKLERLVKGLVR